MGRKYYYAISRGRIAPAITQCWSTASPLVAGYPDNEYKGFGTFCEAKAYLEDKQYHNFYFLLGPIDGPKSSSKTIQSSPCYAVSIGSETGLYLNYSDGVEPCVKAYSGACHKSFATLGAAIAFHEAGEQIRRELADSDAASGTSRVSVTPTYLEDSKKDDSTLQFKMETLTLSSW